MSSGYVKAIAWDILEREISRSEISLFSDHELINKVRQLLAYAMKEARKEVNEH